MSTNNSFKQLMEEEEKQYPHAPPEIERDITGSMRVIKFMGNIVELYLPRIFDLFLSMMGGKNIQTENLKIVGILKVIRMIPPLEMQLIDSSAFY